MSTIQEYIKEARMATNAFGIDSKHAKVAWDAVEEVLAAKSHKAREEHWDKLCDNYPELNECKVYDV